MAERPPFLACPKCGNPVDVDDERGGGTHLVAATKRVDVHGLGVSDVVVPYCPGCGTVLGVLPPPSTPPPREDVVVEEYRRFPS